jgi:hypothetical protein
MLVAGFARHWKSLSHTPLCLTTDPAQGVYIELIAFGYYAIDTAKSGCSAVLKRTTSRYYIFM